MENSKISEETSKKNLIKSNEARQPISTLTSSRSQILKNTLNNMEQRLEILMLSDKNFTDSNRRRRGSASGRAALSRSIENLKLQLLREEREQLSDSAD